MKKTEKSNTNEIIEIPAEEAPYALPDGWKWVRIKDAFDVTSSKRVLKGDWTSSGIPFYRTREIVKLSENGFVDNDLFISKDLYYSLKEKYGIPSKGDLLISGVGTIGIPYVVDNDKEFYFKDGNVIWFKNKGLFNPKFVFYLYKTNFMFNQIHDMTSGTTVDTYTIINAMNTVVPLPPLETQKRIVDRIESLFAKLDEAKEKALTALDTFELRKSAILHKAFTGELTAKWRSSCRASDTSSASAHIESAPAEHIDNTSSDPVEHLNSVASVPVEDSNNIVSVPIKDSNNIISVPIEDSNNIVSVPIKDPNNELSVPSSPSPKQAESDSIEQDIDNSKESIDLNENIESRLSLYKIVTLKEISIKITDGEHKTPKRIESFNGFYLLSARNIHNNFIKLDDVDYVDEDEFNRIRKRCNPEKGDILISCSGSVGRVCVIQDANKYVMVRSAAMIKLKSDNSFYVSYMIQSPNIQKQIDKTKKQSCQANLFLGAIAQLRIPLPPLPEQQEIVRILDDLLAKENAAKEAAEAVIEKIDLMKKSILARAFRGEL